MTDIGDRLKEERARLELTQEKFGELCGAKKRTQINYEQNKNMPDATYLAKAANIGVDVQYVLTGELLENVVIKTGVDQQGNFVMDDQFTRIIPDKDNLTRAIRVISTTLGDRWDTINDQVKADLITKAYEYFQQADQDMLSQEDSMAKIMNDVLKAIV